MELLDHVVVVLFLLFKIFVYLYFWLCWVFTALWTLLQLRRAGSPLSGSVLASLIAVAPFVVEHGL